MVRSLRFQRRVQSLIIAGGVLGILYTASTLIHRTSDGIDGVDRTLSEPLPIAKKPLPAREEKELVVASMNGDDTSWLDEFFDDWKKNVYIVNNASAPLTVPKNKGREAMPFLTYEIDLLVFLSYISFLSQFSILSPSPFKILCIFSVIWREFNNLQIYNRPLQHPPRRLNLHPQSTLPMAQRRPHVRRRARAKTSSTPTRPTPWLRRPPLFLDNGMSRRTPPHASLFRNRRPQSKRSSLRSRLPNSLSRRACPRSRWRPLLFAIRCFQRKDSREE